MRKTTHWKMKAKAKENNGSAWIQSSSIVYYDNKDRYVSQWLLDSECSSIELHRNSQYQNTPHNLKQLSYSSSSEDMRISHNSEPEAPQSNIKRWTKWRTRVNEHLIHNVLVIDQDYTYLDEKVKENVPSSVNCYREASHNMRRSSTDLSLPDFAVYGIPRARLGKDN